MDQLPRLGKRELVCLLSFTCNYVVFVWRGFLFLWVLGMGYVILLWHSLSLPYNYSTITGCLNFWMHILQSGSESLICKAYMEQYNSSPDKHLWKQFVKKMLHDLGFSHVWDNHSSFNSGRCWLQ